MKKLMVFSVILALLAGSVFAVDLGGEVIGTYNLIGGDTDKDANGDSTKPYTGGSMNRIRLQGDGENDDGTFGGWMRVDGVHWSGNPQFEGYAWWKPIDQFLMRIGGNSDGIWGKEGVTGWMFRQRINDTGVVNADDAWGSAYTKDLTFRDAFFGGYGDQRLALEITPMDMIGINLALPFGGGLSENVFPQILVQLDLNLDFGNIAVTFRSAKSKIKVPESAGGTDTIEGWVDASGNPDPNGPFWGKYDVTTPPNDEHTEKGDPMKAFLFFELTSIDNMTLDVGVGIPFPIKIEDETWQDNIAAGIGLKYDINDAFGIKFRGAAGFGGKHDLGVSGVDPEKDNFELVVQVLPYYAVSDSVKVFFDAGLNMAMVVDENVKKRLKDADESTSIVGWHINPYIWVGEEWGPAFWAGIKVWSDGEKKYGKERDAAKIQFEVPIAIGLSF